MTRARNLGSTGGISYISAVDNKIGIGTTNPTNSVLHAEGRNFSFGGPGSNASGQGNLYLGNYSNPQLDPWGRNIRIGSKDQIQIEMYTSWGANYSTGILFSDPDGVALQYSATKNGASRTVYPFYYYTGTTTAGDYLSVELIGGEKLRINSSGNVLIGSGTSTGTANQNLQVTGGAYVSGNLGVGLTNPTSKIHVDGIITCTDLNSTSDINLKENIQKIDDALVIVQEIRGVKFNWKKDDKPSIGVIAQEVEKVLPELVADTETKSVNYNGLIGVLIEAVKEQQEQINTMKKEIEELKK